MNVLAITIFVGAVLAGLFTLLWLGQALSPRPFSEQEALLPLETERTAPPQDTSSTAPKQHP